MYAFASQNHLTGVAGLHSCAVRKTKTVTESLERVFQRDSFSSLRAAVAEHHSILDYVNPNMPCESEALLCHLRFPPYTILETPHSGRKLAGLRHNRLALHSSSR